MRSSRSSGSHDSLGSRRVVPPLCAAGSLPRRASGARAARGGPGLAHDLPKKNRSSDDRIARPARGAVYGRTGSLRDPARKDGWRTLYSLRVQAYPIRYQIHTFLYRQAPEMWLAWELTRAIPDNRLFHDVRNRALDGQISRPGRLEMHPQCLFYLGQGDGGGALANGSGARDCGPIKLVGAAGFEPATTCAQGRCATRLRYAPSSADPTHHIIP